MRCIDELAQTMCRSTTSTRPTSEWSSSASYEPSVVAGMLRPRFAFNLNERRIHRPSEDPPPPRESSQRVLVDPAVFHDHVEVASRVRDERDVLERVAVDEQQVCQRAFLD